MFCGLAVFTQLRKFCHECLILEIMAVLQICAVYHPSSLKYQQFVLLPEVSHSHGDQFTRQPCIDVFILFD